MRHESLEVMRCQREANRKRMEMIADEAVATFISLLHPHKNLSSGMACTVSKFHEDSIVIACDAIEKREEAYRRISYAKHGQWTPMPDGNDMSPEEVRAMYQ